MKTGYIYKLVSPVGKIYIGQSWCFETRIRKYRNLACKRQPKIYNAIKKYGWDNMECSVIDSASDYDELNQKEIYWIEHYNSVSEGYNCQQGGKNASHSPEARLKISKANKGRKRSEEMRAKVSAAHKGRVKTKEHQAKITASLKGRKLSQEHRDKLKGRVCTQATRDKMRIAATGRKLSDQTKLKLAELNKGRKPSNQAELREGQRLWIQENREEAGKQARKNAKAMRKFSDEQVREIRKSKLSCYKLADKYGVGHMTIYSIQKNKSYKDVV